MACVRAGGKGREREARHLLDCHRCFFEIQMETWGCRHLVSRNVSTVVENEDSSMSDTSPAQSVSEVPHQYARVRSDWHYLTNTSSTLNNTNAKVFKEGLTFSDWVLAKEIVQRFHPWHPLNSLIERVQTGDVWGVHRNALNVNKINLSPPNPPNPCNPSQVEGEDRRGR